MAKALTTGDRKGIALQPWALTWWMRAEGMDIDPTIGSMVTIPDPQLGWNWRWDMTSQADQWVEIIEQFREMVLVDESVFIDATLNDPSVYSAIIDGRVAFAGLHPGFLRRVGEGSPAQVAADMGKDFSEVWGWIQHPRGRSGLMGITTPYLDSISFSPSAAPEEIEKAVSLYEYFFLGEGVLRQHLATFEQTGELKRVWGDYPTLTGQTSFEGIPGGPVEAWGQGVVDNFDAAARIPYPPETWQFFPVETNPLPTNTAWTDFVSRMTFEPNIEDIRAELIAAQDSLNAEAAAFTSSVDDAAFLEATRNYFAAQDEHLQANAPSYYDTWKAWYESTIVPILG
jgi:hypothetical protein